VYFVVQQFLDSKLKIQNSKLQKLVSLLLAWFSESARDLPWRRTQDPYAIWVSEIMLQQTQVKTVLPFWERWMREFPTIESVAEASSDKIHKLWEGLGYYTRARNLQKAAKQIIANQSQSLATHNADGYRRDEKAAPECRTPKRKRVKGNAAISGSCKFPQTFDEILALPGIGRYTAGAISSIAFNQPRPILDGNVIRVLARIFGIAQDPREKETNQLLWRRATELVEEASLREENLRMTSSPKATPGLRRERG
jgi:A/G-specific adenine glycosylase